MTRRRTLRRVSILWLATVLSVAGCATGGPDPDEVVPAHPFPRWVNHLETGVTGIGEVEAVFGNPSEIEQAARGGLYWRYSYAEIHWAPDDPDRPAVAADGQPMEVEPSWVDQTIEGFSKTGRFVEDLLYYPPRQPRGPRSKAVDATIHALELRFTTDGVLDHFRYTPRKERIRIPVDAS